MFDLSEEDLARDIVGVGDGPASFNVQMYHRGTPIISVDPIYRYSETELRQRIQETYEDVIAQARRNQDKFVWTRFSSVDELAEIRMQAMEEFCQDFKIGKQQGRYIDASLPNLPFPDRHFRSRALRTFSFFLFSKQRLCRFTLMPCEIYSASERK